MIPQSGGLAADALALGDHDRCVPLPKRRSDGGLCLAAVTEVTKHRKGVCAFEGSVYMFVSRTCFVLIVRRSGVNWK